MTKVPRIWKMTKGPEILPVRKRCIFMYHFSTCWLIFNEKTYIKVMMKEDKKTWQDMILFLRQYILICYNIRCDVLVQSKVLHPPTKKDLQQHIRDVNLVDSSTNQQHQLWQQDARKRLAYGTSATGIKQVGSRCFLRPWWNNIRLCDLLMTNVVA